MNTTARSGIPLSPDTAHYWLTRHAEQRPDAPALLLWRRGRVDERLTYRDLATAVDEAANGLWHWGVRPCERVVLSLPNDAAFVIGMLACQSLGAIPVPAPVPTAVRSAAFRGRITAIVGDCAPVLLLTDETWVDRVREVVDLPMAGIDELRRTRPDARPVTHAASPIALLQYTSGSTGDPRGVVVTHTAMAASCAQAAHAYRETRDDVGVTWVPLYHDMGMVTGLMRPLHIGYPTVLLTPDDFVRDPGVWLSAMTACGGTLSSAPNFAFDLCVRKIDQTRVADWDLRRWRVARNAGEVVRAETADRFTTRFSPAGLRSDALAPSYGLAEATLAVTTCGPQAQPVRLSLDKAALERRELRPANGEQSCELLSSGVPMPGTRIRIEGGDIGRIGISGPQLTPGVWGRALDLRPDRWHLTGDLGFIHDNHLFVVGRADDTLVHHGRNIFLTDVVTACGALPELRQGRVAPFVDEAQENGDRVVRIVAEIRQDVQVDDQSLRTLAIGVKRHLALTLDLFVAEVNFVAAGALPVTTSGKVRVSEVRRLFRTELPLMLPAADRPSPAAAAWRSARDRPK